MSSLGDRRMRVAMSFGVVGPEPTGASVHVTELVRAMLRADESLDLMSLARSRRALHLASVLRIQDERLTARTSPVPERVGRVLDFLRLRTPGWPHARAYDIFHHFGTDTNPVAPSGKLVVTLHDTVALRWPDEEGAMAHVSAGLLRRAAAVVTVSNFAKACITRDFGIDPERVHVIYNGVDHSRFHPRDLIDRELLAPYGLESTPYLLYVGGQTPRKNLPRLLTAYARCRSEGLSLPLILVGPLALLRPEVEKAVAAVRPAAAVRNLGYLRMDIVPLLYAFAEALVFPSLEEGFGMPVIEAMATGTPVVSSNLGSLAEIAGDLAYSVDPQDPASIADGVLQCLSTTPERRAERRIAGIRRAAEFSWDFAAEAHLRLYRELNGRGPESRRRD